jgi:hypothetical protein
LLASGGIEVATGDNPIVVLRKAFADTAGSKTVSYTKPLRSIPSSNSIYRISFCGQKASGYVKVSFVAGDAVYRCVYSASNSGPFGTIPPCNTISGYRTGTAEETAYIELVVIGQQRETPEAESMSGGATNR